MAALRSEIVIVAVTCGSPPSEDYMEAYRALQQRLAPIISTGDCLREVSACPGWNVREVVAHLAGLCEDWLCDRLNGYASDAWTASQVARFADRSCPEILDAWAQAMVAFATIETTMLGSPPARWAFGDAVIHEADIRGVLRAGRVPDGAVLLGLQGTLVRWRQEVLRPAGLLPLRIETPEGWEWRLGRSATEAAGVDLEVPAYELFRALAGRRTPEQVRQWGWSSDPKPYIQAGLPYPFRWASAALTD